jgi:hypothetical protein
MMESVPGAVATGSQIHAGGWYDDDPVATARGTDHIAYVAKDQTT